MSLQFGKGENQLDCGLTTKFDAANRSLLHQKHSLLPPLCGGQSSDARCKFLLKVSHLPENLGRRSLFHG